MSSGVDRRAVRGQETRLKILDAARLMLVEHGAGGTSTRSVAEEAGVPLSLVHYHFGGKQGLLVAVLERENAELLRAPARALRGARAAGRQVAHGL